MKKVLTIMFLFICLGCKKNPDTVVHLSVADFPKESDLLADSLLVNQTILSPMGLAVTDSFLVVNNYKKSICFDCFSLLEGNYLYSDIEKGNGPNDLVAFDALSIASGMQGFNVALQGVPQMKYIHVRADGMRVESSPVLDLKGMPLRNLTLLADSTFVASNSSSAVSELQLYDPKQKKRIEFGQYPDYKDIDLTNEVDRIFVGQKCITAHSAMNKFALFYVWFKEFKIYNSRGELLKHVFIDIPPEIAAFEKEMDRRTIAYSQVVSTEKYIYAVFRNTRKGEKDQNCVHVWNWDGEAVASLRTDIRLQFIAVDRSDGVLYATSPSRSEDYMYKFTLPDFD